MARKHVLAVLGVTALAACAAVFALGAASKTAKTAADDPNNASLTYWYWAENDAPGANNWIKKQVALYEKTHPKVKINVVLQSTDTLTAAFQTRPAPGAGRTSRCSGRLCRRCHKPGPGRRHRSPTRSSEGVKNWIGTAENMSGGKFWAMPQYLLGIPFVWNKAMFKKAGLNPNKPQDVGRVPRRRQEAQSRRHDAVRDGQQGRLRRRLVLLAHRQAEPQFDQRAQARGDRQGLRGAEVLRLLPGARRPQEEGLPQLGCRIDQFHPGLPALRTEEGRDVLGHGRQRRPAAKVLGATKGMGVWAIPIWGKGKLAKSYDMTQSARPSSQVVEASASGRPVPNVPALPAGAQGLVQGDRRVPGRQAVPGVVGQDPIAKKQLALDQSPVSVWPENYIPPQVDQNADLAAGELITSGAGSPADAVKLWKRELDNEREPSRRVP